MDHSKELDLYFSELYWSSFLGSVQKKPWQKQNGLSEKNVFVYFRTEIESAHAKRLFITKLPLIIGAVFNGEKNFHILVGHNSGGLLSQFRNCDFGPELCPTKIGKFFSPKQTVPIISVNFVMKSRFACADSISVRKHTAWAFFFAPSTVRPLARDLRVLIAGHFLWVLVWTGACYWHGVGGFMFNSSSSSSSAWAGFYCAILLLLKPPSAAALQRTAGRFTRFWRGLANGTVPGVDEFIIIITFCPNETRLFVLRQVPSTIYERKENHKYPPGPAASHDATPPAFFSSPGLCPGQSASLCAPEGGRFPHGTSFLAPGSLARRRLARVIHHHHRAKRSGLLFLKLLTTPCLWQAPAASTQKTKRPIAKRNPQTQDTHLFPKASVVCEKWVPTWFGVGSKETGVFVVLVVGSNKVFKYSNLTSRARLVCARSWWKWRHEIRQYRGGAPRWNGTARWGARTRARRRSRAPSETAAAGT